SQVRKHERNYTVIVLGYTVEPENPCKPRHHKNPAVTQTIDTAWTNTLATEHYTSQPVRYATRLTLDQRSMSSTSRRSEMRNKNNHNCRSLAGLQSHA
ncbi:hypothetical protein Taro_042938, partial [Colocasia esculenta]|nr:hypothetical protein [Colocasia esculenta]